MYMCCLAFIVSLWKSFCAHHFPLVFLFVCDGGLVSDSHRQRKVAGLYIYLYIYGDGVVALQCVSSHLTMGKYKPYNA